MWVQLLIPRIEDGNNFGVSIQVMCPHCKLGATSLGLSLFPWPLVLLLDDVQITVFTCSSPQEETVAELRTVESEAASYLDQISR